MSRELAFVELFIALYAGHQVADHWFQTHGQANAKGLPGWPGRLADLRHVTTLTGTKVAAVALVWFMAGLAVTPWAAVALAVDATSHYWADRKSTLLWLATAMGPRFGKGDFYRLGMPRPGHDDNPSMGTGAYALDQAWHIGWLFIAALIAAH